MPVGRARAVALGHACSGAATPTRSGRTSRGRPAAARRRVDGRRQPADGRPRPRDPDRALQRRCRWTRATRSTRLRGAGRRSASRRSRRRARRRAPYASYQTLTRSNDGDRALRRSPYARTWALARRLMRESATPYEYVVAVNRYLQDGFRYDETPDPVGRRASRTLDGFLFDTKSGYCQHFSGAMAILLRMGGIPARVVTGFSPGGFSKRKQAWIVRDTDAHSWVEAWFDDYGWVTFDPTPAGTPARSQIAAIERPPEESSDRGDAGLERGRLGAAHRRRRAPTCSARSPARAARPRRRARTRRPGVVVVRDPGGAARRARRRGSRCAAPAQPGPGRGARSRGRRARGGAAADRPPGARGHDAAPARAAASAARPRPPPTCARCAPAATRRPRRRRRRVGAAPCAGSWRAEAARAAGCARCGRCRPGARSGSAGRRRTRRSQVQPARAERGSAGQGASGAQPARAERGSAGQGRARLSPPAPRGGTAGASRRGSAPGAAPPTSSTCVIAAATAGWRSAISACIWWATAR